MLLISSFHSSFYNFLLQIIASYHMTSVDVYFAAFSKYIPSFTSLALLPAGGAKRNLPVLFLLTGRFWVFAPHWSRLNLTGRSEPFLPAKCHLNRLRGVSLLPQNLKIWNFTNTIALKGAGPLHDSYKKIYTVYARPSLHNVCQIWLL